MGSNSKNPKISNIYIYISKFLSFFFFFFFLFFLISGVNSIDYYVAPPLSTADFYEAADTSNPFLPDHSVRYLRAPQEVVHAIEPF
jgi:hypothetical protein